MEDEKTLRIATHVTDDMTFSQAFDVARAEVGPGGVFYYCGHLYGTYYESEWNSLSSDDRADYWASVTPLLKSGAEEKG